MEDKKNIDRLFQERFKDFEPAAPAGVWDNIESQLDQDKKRPAMIPLWWKIAGVAAVFAVILSVFLWNTDDRISSDLENKVVIENPTDSNSTQESDDDNNISSGAVAQEEDATTNEEVDSDVVQKENRSRLNNAVANKESRSTAPKTTSSTQPIVTLEEDDNRIRNQQNAIAQNGNNKNPQENNTTTNDSIDPVNRNDNNSDSISTENAIAQAESKTQANKQEKESTLEEIAIANTEDTKPEEQTTTKKWSAATVVAPVFANTIGGSSINDRVSSNRQNTQTDFSYGVAVSYDVNSRWSVRTGVHQVNMNYNTQDISYGLNATTFLLNDAQTTTIFNANAVNPGSNGAISNTPSIPQDLQSANLLTTFKGELSQQLGYVEVPLEVKYRLLDKKFGVSVLGGFSALFLTDNQVFIENNGRSLDLGEDRNFNDFNQSANFGLGIDYQFSKSLGLSVEPTFKYQLNALREDIADFRPYTIGVYTGLKYKF